MRPRPDGLPRRRFLALLGFGASASLLAACQPAAQPAPTVPPAAPKQTDAPKPAAQPTTPPAAAKPTEPPKPAAAATTAPTAAAAKPTAAPAAQPTAATRAPAAVGKPGGELRIDALSEPTNGLDLIRFNATEGQRIYRLTNSQLLKFKEDKTLEPDLAAAMPEVSADRLTYTFKLKQGVKWHDGQPFDSSDVKYTIDQVLTPANASVWTASLSFVEGATAPDPQTVVVKLKSQFTPIMNKFALVPIISSKIPYETNKTYAASLIGTGPYKFASWDRGQQIVLEKNPDYFVQGRPYINRITVRLVPENAARIANLRNNTTHLLSDAPAAQIDVLKQTGQNVMALPNSATRYYAYPMFKAGEPTANVDMRRAIAWSIDRQAMLDQVLGGQGVAASTYLSSGSQYFDEKVGTTFGNKPDMTRARDFLQKAGGAPNRPLTIVVQNLPDLVDCATILQSNLKAIGLDARIQAEEIAAFLPKLTGNDGYDLLIIRGIVSQAAGFGSDYPYLGLLTGSPTNFNKYTDPKMDDLLKAAVSAPDGAQAQAAWRAVQEYDIETLPNIQFVTARSVEAWSNTLQYEPSSLAMLQGLTDASFV
jgi:peptide/nickel transport system substrate-binding protein